MAKQKIVVFDPPNSIATYAWSLNESGTIAGFYFDGSDSRTKGFLRAADGTITTFEHGKAQVTAAYGIDKKGRAAGYWSTAGGDFPGFVRVPDGTLRPFRVSGGVSGTFPIAMNEKKSNCRLVVRRFPNSARFSTRGWRGGEPV